MPNQSVAPTETDPHPVIDRGGLTLYRDNAFNNRQLVLFRAGENLALLSTEARSAIPIERASVLDDILFELRLSGVAIQYVADFRGTFDDKQRIAAFFGSDDEAPKQQLNEQYTLGLTADEIGAARAFTEAKKIFDRHKRSIMEKMRTRFAKPRLPSSKQVLVDVDTQFGDEADQALEWVAGEPNMTLVPQSRRDGNLLRIKDREVQTITGYNVPLATGKRIAKFAMTIWSAADGPGEGDLSFKRFGDDMKAAVRQTYIKIGCQEIPRSEVERLVRENNWA